MSKFVVTNMGESSGFGLSNDLGMALCRACGVDPNYVRRMVLDLAIGEPAKLYLEMYAEAGILNVDLAEAGIELKATEVTPDA